MTESEQSVDNQKQEEKQYQTWELETFAEKKPTNHGLLVPAAAVKKTASQTSSQNHMSHASSVQSAPSEHQAAVPAQPKIDIHKMVEELKQQFQAKMDTQLQIVNDIAVHAHNQMLIDIEQFSDSLGHLLTSVVRAVSRATLDVKPEILESVIQETIKVLPKKEQEKMRLHLNQHDLEFLLEDNKETINNLKDLEFIEDSSLTPGGCLLETPRMVVDHTFESTIHNLMTQALKQQGAKDE